MDIQIMQWWVILMVAGLGFILGSAVVLIFMGGATRGEKKFEDVLGDEWVSGQLSDDYCKRLKSHLNMTKQRAAIEQIDEALRQCGVEFRDTNG
uniref:Uncharacterized protein n=1 Tax=viral metagenome TaxID=1070528 RepID=A0A6M3JT11_9ZZZZ